MRAIKEIRQELKTKIEGFDNVSADNKAEALKEIKKLTAELQEAQELERSRQLIADDQIRSAEKSAGRKFSIIKFLREASKGKLEGLEAEVAEIGKEEMLRNGLPVNGYAIPSSLLRASSGQNATTDADGGYLKETSGVKYIEALKKQLILTDAGATFLGDLVGTIPIVTDGNFTAGWGAEGDEATITKITFTKATMTPHRCYVAASISKDLLRQTSVDVENIVWMKLIQAHAQLIETAAINGSGNNNQPTGILNTSGIGAVAGGTNGAAISWANIVKLETEVDVDDAIGDKMAYITNSKVIGNLKTIEKSTNTARFLLDDNKMLNGYPCRRSNNIPSTLTKGTSSGVCSAMIFGNFADLWIGSWGGIDIVVDPYTSAKKAEINLVLNAWNDVKVVRAESFAAIKDITIS